MLLFLISFLSLYGGMHAYVFFRLRSIVPLQPALTGLLALVMILMTIAPLLVRISERTGLDRVALAVAWPGFLWMGCIFLLFSTLIIFDAARAAVHLSSHLFSTPVPVCLSARFTCLAALLIAVIASIYACFEAQHIRSEHVVLTTTKLPVGVQKVRIVQISDVHVGLLIGERRLERIVKHVKDAGPDILVSTGDLVDGRLNLEKNTSGHTSLSTMLSAVSAPLGKFAVIGNHEVYADLREALVFTHSAGFTVLRNSTITLPNGIVITGIDDLAAHQKLLNLPPSEKVILESVPRETFHLLLKHRPEIKTEHESNFDLMLSGHLHKGQLFPFNYLVKLKYSIPSGTSITGQGSRIHVSRGTGTWGPPMRLFAPPEVTVIDIVSSTYGK